MKYFYSCLPFRHADKQLILDIQRAATVTVKKYLDGS